MVLTRARLSRLLPLLALLYACTTGQALRPESGDNPAADPAIRARFEAWSDATPIYHIGEGDKLRIQFPLTPEMDDDDVVVRPDGMITLRTGDEVEVSRIGSGRGLAPPSLEVRASICAIQRSSSPFKIRFRPGSMSGVR